MALYTAIINAVDAVATNFVAFNVPLYILVFAVVFIVLAKFAGIPTGQAVMVFLISASAAYLLLTTGITLPGGFSALVTASDVAIGSGLVFTSWVLWRVGKVVAFV
ncbi:MAG: hypothetical protein ABH829_00885 [archaeon]